MIPLNDLETKLENRKRNRNIKQGRIKNQRSKKNLKLIKFASTFASEYVFKSSEKEGCGVQLSTYI